MWIYDVETLRFLDVNSAAVRQYGYSRDDFLQMTILDIRPSEEASGVIDDVAAAAGAVGPQVWWHRHKSGDLFTVEITADDVELDGRAARLVLARDFRGQSLLDAVIEGVPDPIFLKDRRGRYLLMNSAGAARFRLPLGEILGRSDADLLPPDSARIITESDALVMATGEPHVQEAEIAIGGDRVLFLVTKAPWRDAAGAVQGVVGTARDVTERKALEAQLRRTRKMEAVGRLTGGIAHDFNNLLTVIQGHLELALVNRSLHWTVAPGLEIAADAAGRAADLTRRLLTFSREQLSERQVIHLDELVRETHRMLGRIIGEDVEVVFELDPQTPTCVADHGQLEQVLMNLVVNARDAMPGGGRLILRTGIAQRPPADLDPGPYTLLEVRDAGVGIAPEVLEQVFDPFFTTKPEGTGLGLATVQGIVRQHGGSVEVTSHLGEGTSFRIYLPAEEAEEIGPRPPLAAAPPDPSEEIGILVVEDEGTLRFLIRRVLEDRGYTVFEAEGGEQALVTLERRERPIQLVLSDVVMPRLSGGELARRIRESRPDVRLLFMSGYTEAALPKDHALPAGSSILHKPFLPEDLARAVKQALGHAAP